MPSKNEPQAEGASCPVCGSVVPEEAEVCPGCGRPKALDEAFESVDDLLAGVAGLDRPEDENDFLPGLTPTDAASPQAPPSETPRPEIDLDSVDDLLEKISNPDTLFSESDPEPGEPSPEEIPPPSSSDVPAVAVLNVRERPRRSSAPQKEKKQKQPKGKKKKKGGKARPPSPVEDDDVAKIRRITMVERKRRRTEIRRGGKVQCSNCKQIFDLAKLPSNVDKCLNCGCKVMSRIEDDTVRPRTEFYEDQDFPEEEVLIEEVEEVEEEGEEEWEDEGEEEYAEEEEVATAGWSGDSPPAGEEPIATAREDSLVSKRKGHKDYYEEYRGDENIYEDLDLESGGRRTAAEGETPEEEKPSARGWAEALKGKLDITRRAEEEAALRDDYFIGKKIRDFLILEIIGRGGMGTVFKARREDGSFVAVKVLPPIYSRDDSKVDRFLKEAEAASKMDHPNIVQVFEFGKAGDVHFIAMELVVGQSVGDLIKNRRAVKIEESLRIIRDAARGLAAAHEKGIIHRDMKPDNIMITENGKIQVADFGLARDMSTSSLSGTGEIVGTPYYISPEQIDCQDVDARADIYSLGATIYHLITGKRPFEGTTPMEVLLKHMNEKLVAPNDRNPLIPVPVSRLISKMMEKDRGFRYQDCEDLISDIDLIERGETPQIILEAETEPKKKSSPPVLKGSRARILWTLFWILLLGGSALGLRFAALPPLAEGAYFPPDETRLARARTALRLAREHIEAYPDKPAETRRMLQAVMDEHPGTEEAEEAGTELRKLDVGLRKKAQDWVDQRAGVARSLRNGRNFGRAILEALAPPPAMLEGRSELDELSSLAQSIADELLKQEGMVLIRGGTVASRGGRPGAPSVEVKPFLIDLTEVTNRDYLEFVRAEGVRAPWTAGAPTQEQMDQPVTGLDWKEAAAYARYRGKRLPTEPEWELAAAGAEGRTFPWGKAFEIHRAHCRRSQKRGPVPVVSYPEGRTPEGLYHMAGNVHEWTATDWEGETTFKVVRGGSWMSHPFNLRTDARARVDAATCDETLGFRLARDP